MPSDTIRELITSGAWHDALPAALRPAAVRARLAADDPAARFEDGVGERTGDGWDRGVWTGGVPALLTHPEDGWHEAGASPAAAPVVVWFHGRTVNKELDPGRYLRWKRLGIAACAIDLPGHGERSGETQLTTAKSTLRVAEQQAREIDAVLNELADPRFNGAFDLSRVAIGGMSAGGMVTTIRLTAPGGTSYACDRGPCGTFRAAVIEASAGDFTVMEGHDFFVPERVERLNPIAHVGRVEEVVPVLAVHSELDAWVPIAGMSRFIDTLRLRYESIGGSADDARLHTWDKTGAPHEHMGFGSNTNETKNLENAFLAERLGLG